MKYVMNAYQTVTISGTINTPEAGNFNGIYNNQEIVLSKDFLQFEHTNGLNYVNFDLERTETLWVGKINHVSLGAVVGLGAGIMYPKSDIKLFGKGQDRWHLAGYGVSSHAGLRLEFLKNMYLQAQFDYGFINMPDILTTVDNNARAKQHFFYSEETVVIGRYLQFHRKPRS